MELLVYEAGMRPLYMDGQDFKDFPVLEMNYLTW
jgi:hypothetical protein